MVKKEWEGGERESGEAKERSGRKPSLPFPRALFPALPLSCHEHQLHLRLHFLH
jgi:hypothetical protein